MDVQKHFFHVSYCQLGPKEYVKMQKRTFQIFNISTLSTTVQDLVNPVFRFFFQIFEKFCLEDIWSPKILTRNSEKSKKIQIFSNKSYLFWLNMNSTCSQLSFEVCKVSVAQNLKFWIFLGQNSLKFSKFQILSYINVIYLKRKLKSCRI